MAITKNLLERSPFYALVGAADVAFENVRTSLDNAAGAAASLRADYTPEQVQQRIAGGVNDVRGQIAALPSLATERYETVAATVERTYEEFAQGYLDLAQRGVEVTREATAQGRSAVDAARGAARESGDNTVAAVYGARKEAAKGARRAAGRVSRAADSVEADAETAVRSDAAKEGAARRPSRRAVADRAATSTTTKSTAKKPAARKTAAKKTTTRRTPAKKTTAKKA